MIWMLFIRTMALSLGAAARVNMACHRYNQDIVRSGITGGQVAAEILRRTGVRDLGFAVGARMLGDHYDPIPRQLVLSPANVLGLAVSARGRGTNASNRCSARACGSRVAKSALSPPFRRGGPQPLRTLPRAPFENMQPSSRGGLNE